MKKIFHLGTYALLLFSFIGCKKGTESPKPLPIDGKGNTTSSTVSTATVKPSNSNQRPPSGQTSSVTSSEDSSTSPVRGNLGQKLDRYIDCVNDFSDSVFSSYERYASWCNKNCEKNGPSGKETYIMYGLYKMSDPSECLKKIKEANQMRPSLPEVEKIALAYGEAIKNLYPVIKDAYEYYDQKNYEDDKGAKGRELHPKLLAGWKAFAIANRDFQAQIDVLEDKSQAERLARLEKDLGRTFPFLQGSILVRAKAVMKAAEVEKMDGAALSTLTQTIEECEKAVAELTEYMDLTKHPERKQEFDKIMGASSFLDGSKDFLKSAKALMRRFRDKTKITSHPSMIQNGMVEGTIQNVLKEYNNLIHDANTIHYL